MKTIAQSFRKIINNQQVAPYFLVIVICLLPRILVGPAFIDDAYIYFRYTENFLKGNSLVYNPNEYVLGATSFLYQIFLILFSIVLKTPTNSAFAIGILTQCGIALWIFFFLKKHSRSFIPWVGVFVYSINPAILMNGLSGMETSLFIWLILSAIGFLSINKRTTANIFIGLVGITRPEGVLFTVIFSLYLIFRSKKIMLRELLIQFSPIAITSIILQTVYGSFLPNSVTAKANVYPQYEHGLRNLNVIVQSLGDFLYVYHGQSNNMLATIIFGGIFIIGLIWLVKRDSLVLPFFIWVFFLGIAYSVTNRFMFSWYVVPFIFSSVFVFPYSLIAFDEMIRKKFQQGRTSSMIIASLKIAVIGLFFIIQMINMTSYIFNTKVEISKREEKYRQIGEALTSQLGQRYTVASVDIGAIGYFYGGRILDLTGLISRESVRYYQQPEYSFEYPHKIPPNLLFKEHFDILVTYDLFLSEYETLSRFHDSFVKIFEDPERHHYFGQFQIYVRKDLPEYLNDPDFFHLQLSH